MWFLLFWRPHRNLSIITTGERKDDYNNYRSGDLKEVIGDVTGNINPKRLLPLSAGKTYL